MSAPPSLEVFLHNRVGRKGVPMRRSFERWIRAALRGRHAGRVAIAVENRQSRMHAGGDRLADHVRRIGEVDEVHFAARRHHGADRLIAEPHHAGDHFLLARLQHAGGFRLAHKRADFVLGDGLLADPALAE